MKKPINTSYILISATLIGLGLIFIFSLSKSKPALVIVSQGDAIYESSGHLPYLAFFGNKKEINQTPTKFIIGKTSITFIPEVEAKEIKKQGDNQIITVTLDGTKFIQTLKETGVKEEIVIQKPVEKINFVVNLEGVAPKKLKGLWRFFDEEGKEQFFIPQPFMKDAKGERSEEVEITIAAKDYTITITPNRGWLSDPSRVYPIIIDPTLEIPETPIEELLSKRTRTSKTYDLNNGKFVWEGSIAPVHFQDKEGDWQDITNKITAKKDEDGFAFGVDELFDIRFAKATRAGLPLIKVGTGEGTVEMTAKGINNSVEAVIEDNRITYPKAWDNADLSWVIAGHIIRKEITLYNNHPTVFSFELSGAALIQQDGYVSIEGVGFDLTNGYLENPNDQLAENIPVETAVRRQNDKQYIDLILPAGDWAGWVLDPTLTLWPDPTDGIDNALQQPTPNTNRGTENWLAIGKTGTDAYRSLIKFNLSSLPDSALISSTILSLYCNVDGSSNARTFRVYRQLRAWEETTSTWNVYKTGSAWQAAGGFGADDCEQTGIGSRAFTATETLNEFKDFVLTPSTKAGLDLENGWLLKADTEINDMYSFASSDHVIAAYRPKLAIDYTLPPIRFEGLKMEGIKIDYVPEDLWKNRIPKTQVHTKV